MFVMLPSFSEIVFKIFEPICRKLKTLIVDNPHKFEHNFLVIFSARDLNLRTSFSKHFFFVFLSLLSFLLSFLFLPFFFLPFFIFFLFLFFLSFFLSFFLHFLISFSLYISLTSIYPPFYFYHSSLLYCLLPSFIPFFLPCFLISLFPSFYIFPTFSPHFSYLPELFQVTPSLRVKLYDSLKRFGTLCRA